VRFLSIFTGHDVWAVAERVKNVLLMWQKVQGERCLVNNLRRAVPKLSIRFVSSRDSRWVGVFWLLRA